MAKEIIKDVIKDDPSPKIKPAFHAANSRHNLGGRWVILQKIEGETLPILTEKEMLEYYKDPQFQHLFELVY